ncbi:hypothetical protein RI367_001054 [Sorochytrium milnesiophthora]
MAPLPDSASGRPSLFDSSNGENLGDSISYRLMHPSDSELRTMYFILGYTVGILILWNLPYLKYILYPFKLVTVAWHELSHAIAGICTGAKIESIQINPDEGGVTYLRGGKTCCVLPAGYIGSSVVGAILIFCGFNITASKVAAVLICLSLVAVIFWAKDWFTRLLTFFFIVLMVVLWVFTPESSGLIYVVLFMGVMSACYSLWDIVEDLIRRRVNESDASKFAERYGCCPPQFWGFFWFLVSLVFVAIAIVAALIVW